MATPPYPIVLMMSDVKPFGGAEHFFTLLVRHLNRDLVSPRVVVPRVGAMVDAIRATGVPVDVIPLTRPLDIRHFPGFLGLLESHGTRLVNAHGVRAGFFGALARKRLPLRVVVTEHNLRERQTMLNGFIDRFVARNIDRRVTVSQAVADGLVASGVCGPDEIQVIHVAVETERHRPDPARREAARRRFGIAEGELAVVAAGRFHPMKGFIDLIEAAPAIAGGVPNARIILAGDGEERDRFRRRIDALGVGNAVSLPGYVKDMPELLVAADVFVLPSVELPGSPREGLPMVITEALASGCPVVTTAVSGNREIVSDGVNGLIVPQQDPAALAAGIVRILRHPDRRRMGENGRRIVTERFGIERVAGEYTDLFLRLIEGR